MCAICCAEHRQHISFRSHVPVLVDDVTPEMVHVPVTCPMHGDDHLISGFCANCRVGVCSACVAGVHIAHTIERDNLDTTIYADVCRRFDEELTVRPSQLNGIAATLRILDELMAAGTANVQTQHAIVANWAATSNSQAQTCATDMVTRVNAMWDERRQALAAQRHDVAQRVHAFDQAHHYATALRRLGSTREILAASAFATQRLSALRTWLRPVEPCVSCVPITVVISLVTGLMVNGRLAYGQVAGPPINPWQQGWSPRTIRGRAHIYAVGGCSPGITHATVERYDPSMDAWVSLEHLMSEARQSHSCVVLNARLYVLGGFSCRGSKNSVEVYDPVSNSWDDRYTGVSRFGRWTVACVAHGESIYAIGNVSNEYNNPDTATHVERFDVFTLRWEPRAQSALSHGSFFACAVLDDHIYVTGGLKREVLDEEHGVGRTVERYDPTRDCWEPVPDMPLGRHSHAAAVLDDHLYVIGGSAGDGRRVDRFDPVRSEWESVAPLLEIKRSGLAAVAAGEHLYAIGGQHTGKEAMSMEAYDPVMNLWLMRAPMKSARMELAAAVVSIDEL